MSSESSLNSASGEPSKKAVVQAGNYLNKLTGEQIERECRLKLQDGCDELVLNFSETELVNSVWSFDPARNHRFGFRQRRPRCLFRRAAGYD
jgi:hypothetical protein